MPIASDRPGPRPRLKFKPPAKICRKSAGVLLNFFPKINTIILEIEGFRAIKVTIFKILRLRRAMLFKNVCLVQFFFLMFEQFHNFSKSDWALNLDKKSPARISTPAPAKSCSPAGMLPPVDHCQHLK